MIDGWMGGWWLDGGCGHIIGYFGKMSNSGQIATVGWKLGDFSTD